MKKIKVKCNVCEGRGWIKVHYYDKDKATICDCNLCNGTGKRDFIDMRNNSKGKRIID